MWKIRIRSTGVRMKPVYTNDRYLPRNVKAHYAKFLNAMLNVQHYYYGDFHFDLHRGVIKHSTRAYAQVKNDNKRKSPSSNEAICEAFLPLFISRLVAIVDESPFKDRIDQIKHQLFIDDHGVWRTCETTTEAVIYMYHRWVENPNYFDQFY